MDSLVLKFGYLPNKRPVSRLIHRQYYGPPGPDYSTVLTLDNKVAHALGENGLIVWENHLDKIANRPGILFIDNDNGNVAGEVRTSLSDPNTKVGEFTLDRYLAEEICRPNQAHFLRWLYRAPSLQELGLEQAS